MDEGTKKTLKKTKLGKDEPHKYCHDLWRGESWRGDIGISSSYSFFAQSQQVAKGI